MWKLSALKSSSKQETSGQKARPLLTPFKYKQASPSRTVPGRRMTRPSHCRIVVSKSEHVIRLMPLGLSCALSFLSCAFPQEPPCLWPAL